MSILNVCANKNVNYYYLFFSCLCVFLTRPCNAHALYLFVFIPSLQCSRFILVCFYPVLAMLMLYICLFLSRPCNAHALYLFVFIPSLKSSRFILVCFYPVFAMLTLYTCLFLSRVCIAQDLYLFVSSLVSIEHNFPDTNLSPSLSYITNDKSCIHTASKQKCLVIYHHKAINNYLAIEILTVRL